jgi:hypothetical protein
MKLYESRLLKIKLKNMMMNYKNTVISLYEWIFTKYGKEIFVCQ